MTETLADGYSSESTQRELSNEYQRDGVYMFVFFNLCIPVLWTKVASALARGGGGGGGGGTWVFRGGAYVRYQNLKIPLKH